MSASGEVGGPAVGGGDGGVEFVVELAEDRDEAVVVDGLFLGGEGASGAEGGEDVVHRREREAGVLGLDAFAVGVECFAQGPDAGPGGFVAGEKGGEATEINLSEIISEYFLPSPTDRDID